jgi:hypothetical protein
MTFRLDDLSSPKLTAEMIMQDWPDDSQPNEELKKRIVESALCRSRRDQNSLVKWIDEAVFVVVRDLLPRHEATTKPHRREMWNGLLSSALCLRG